MQSKKCPEAHIMLQGFYPSIEATPLYYFTSQISARMGDFQLGARCWGSRRQCLRLPSESSATRGVETRRHLQRIFI